MSKYLVTGRIPYPLVGCVGVCPCSSSCHRDALVNIYVCRSHQMVGYRLPSDSDEYGHKRKYVSLTRNRGFQ